MKIIRHFQWKQFFKRLYDKVFETDIFSRAAQTAFYFSFAIFPLLYFLISVFGLVIGSSEDWRSQLFDYVRRVMPGTAFDLVHRTVEEVVLNSSGGKATIGLVITLWTASAGLDAIRSALNAVYELRETRSWWRTKAESLALTLVITILTGIVLSSVFYGWQLIQIGTASIGVPVTSPTVLIAIQWASILLVMLFAFEVIYNLLPNFKRFDWLWITPGSVVGIVLWLVLTGGFRLYITSFGSYDKTYGSLGAVMILMFWLYLTALVVMIGGAINSVYADVLDEIVDEIDDGPVSA